MKTDKADKIIAFYDGEKEALIPILQDIQLECNYLPEDALRHVARELKLPLSQVFSVATYYSAFSLTPRGRHLVSVCLGTACHVRGAPRILDSIQRTLKIEPGETTPDRQFSLEAVNCLGACALGPLMVIDGEYFGKMSARKVESILKRYKKSSKSQKKQKDEKNKDAV